MNQTEVRNQNHASLAENEEGDRVIKISFPHDLELLHKVRTLQGRKYHKENNCWSVPIHQGTIDSLTEWQFIFSDGLQKFLEKLKRREKQVTLHIKGLKGTLRPFQGEGVAFTETKNGRVLIADEMGLGKTIEALAWLQLHRDKIPVIIVTPASAKLNWARETEIWLPNPNIEILVGTTPYRTTGDILIINYDILPNDYEPYETDSGKKRKREIKWTGWLDYLIDLNPQVLITDESHFFKNNSANRTLAIKRLAKNIPHVLCLTGTPIENRPSEIFNAVHIIDNTIFPVHWAFLHKYCGAKKNGFGWDFSGATHTDKLHKILTSTIMIRRLKKDVMPELPDKSYSFIPMELDNSKEYRTAEENFIEFIKREKGAVAALKASKATALVTIEGLKQLAVKGALPSAITWIEDFLDTGNKLVVFAEHKFVIAALMERFKTIAVKLDGSLSLTQKQKSVDEFQNNPEIVLFVGNIKAAGIAITLTAASSVAFLELPWTPGALAQAIDRVHRIGQKDSVNVYYLFAVNTIMEKIAHLIDTKKLVLDAVLDGIDTVPTNLLRELMKSYEPI